MQLQEAQHILNEKGYKTVDESVYADKLIEAIDVGDVSATDVCEYLLDPKWENTRLSEYTTRPWLFDNKWILCALYDCEDISDSDVPRLNMVNRTILQFIDDIATDVEVLKIAKDLIELSLKEQDGDLETTCDYLEI